MIWVYSGNGSLILCLEKNPVLVKPSVLGQYPTKRSSLFSFVVWAHRPDRNLKRFAGPLYENQARVLQIFHYTCWI